MYNLGLCALSYHVPFPPNPSPVNLEVEVGMDMEL